VLWHGLDVWGNAIKKSYGGSNITCNAQTKTTGGVAGSHGKDGFKQVTEKEDGQNAPGVQRGWQVKEEITREGKLAPGGRVIQKENGIQTKSGIKTA